MNPPYFNLKGKLPTLLYLTIRQHHREIAAMEARPDISLRQKAAHLRISTITYTKILSLGPDFFARVQEAESSGNWTAIEDELFAKYGDYHLVPSYQKLMKQLGGQPVPVPQKDNLPHTHERRKPPALDTDRTKVHRWLLLGEAAERLLTPEAVTLLLRVLK